MENKHTRLGIASFALSALAAGCTFALFALGLLLRALIRGDHHDFHFLKVLFLLGLFAIFFMNLASLGLGIAGLAQTERKKLFAVLGTVFASMQIVATLLILLANMH
ncbi:MAG TPA: hypothetical protein VK843_16870 [Planctomycetota bacterium]|nr:hypothetical protein [Planctomycetota bacterium]